MHVRTRVAGLALAVMAMGAGTFGWQASPASAQIPPPPVLVYGSITDEAGEIPAGVPVEAYIGDVECTSGLHRTGRTGEGAAEVATFALDVFVAQHREGCAQDGAVVRIKIGDRFADQTATISSEEIVYRVDVTFGAVEPDPIPTFTPTPQQTANATPASTAGASGTTSAQETSTTPTPSAEGTPGGDAGTSSDGDVVAVPDGSTPGDDDSNAAGGSSDDGDGGFPMWGAVLLGVVGLAAVGGGVGYAMLRSNGTNGGSSPSSS